MKGGSPYVLSLIHIWHRYLGKLLEYAKNVAASEGATHIYISTDHMGLYEKYGYSFYKLMKDDENQDSRVYKINL